MSNSRSSSLIFKIFGAAILALLAPDTAFAALPGVHISQVGCGAAATCYTYLGGNYMEIGIGPNGSHGITSTDVSGPPLATINANKVSGVDFFGRQVGDGIGLVGDINGFGVGNDLRIDYFLPGTPAEGWGVFVGATSAGINDYDNSEIPVTSVSNTSSGNTLSWTGVHTTSMGVSGIEVTQVGSFDVNDDQMTYTVTLRNTTGSPISDILYYRYVDPDNTVDMGGSYTTVNTITSQGDGSPSSIATVKAESIAGDPYDILAGKVAVFGYTSLDPRATVYENLNFGGFVRSDFSSPPATNDTVTADQLIAIAFTVPNLDAGASTSFTYNTALGNAPTPKNSQTISFTIWPASVTVGGIGTVSATGGASGNPVTFTSITAGVCSIAGSTVTGITAGTCTIAANQAGNGSYDAAPQVTQSFTIGAGVVDLTVSALTSSADGHSVNVGDTVTINSTISNLGTSATTMGIPVFFYLSTDPNITMSDTLLSGTGLLGLAAGQSSNLSTTVTLPLNLAPGTYYIGAIVDPANYHHESNESNNTQASATPFTVVRNVDLTVTATSNVDGLNTVKPGDPVIITAIVHNAGSTTTTAPDIAVSYYLSTDATITQADRPIGSSGLYRLAAGASGATSATVYLPLDLVAGATYYIGAIADPTNAQPETNKANNSNTLQPPTSFTVSANAIADLTVSAPSYTAINVLGGDTFTVSTTVNNIGNAATTAPIAVSYYLTTDPNAAHLTTTSGTLVGSSGVPGLAAGGSSSTSATVTLPLNLSAGTYYIGAIVDAGNVQNELSKTNNTAVGAAFTVLASTVDLTISTPTYTVSGSVNSGAPVTIYPVTVTNNGNAPTSAPIVVSYYLTASYYAPSIPETGILIGSSGVPGLAAGGSSNTSAVTAHLPLNLAPGTYYIGAYVNPGNVQPESNTGNNGKVGASFVVTTSSVQLSVTSLGSPAEGYTLYDGDQITIYAYVHNGGNAATTAPVAVSYYLTTDSNAVNLPGSGIAIGSSGISHIAAGSNANTSVTATLPLTLPPNIYYIGVIVDPSNAEAVETNNKAVTAETFTVKIP